MIAWLRGLFGHDCDHDWWPVGFLEVDEEYEYVRMDECSKCLDVMFQTP